MSVNKVRLFKAATRIPAALSETTPILRQELITSSNSWVGIALTKAGLTSDWHHHTDNDTYGYLISGRLRFEFGPGGKESVEVGPGDVFHVPAGIIHREVTLDEDGKIFLVRVGTGIPVVNVEKPE